MTSEHPVLRADKIVFFIRVLLSLIAVTHLVVPALMWMWRARLAIEVATLHPELTGAQIADAVVLAVRAAMIFHGVFFILSLIPAMALAKRRVWALWLVIVPQALAIAFSLVSWRSSAMFHSLIPIVDVAQIAAIGLSAWVLMSSRRAAPAS